MTMLIMVHFSLQCWLVYLYILHLSSVYWKSICIFDHCVHYGSMNKSKRSLGEKSGLGLVVFYVSSRLSQLKPMSICSTYIRPSVLYTSLALERSLVSWWDWLWWLDNHKKLADVVHIRFWHNTMLIWSRVDNLTENCSALSRVHYV